jgi:hypothetical protein
MTKPAYKKWKLSSAGLVGSGAYSDFQAQHLLAEEFDLEIALRQWLAATIESGVTWALLLHETLLNNVTICQSMALTLILLFFKILHSQVYAWEL